MPKRLLLVASLLLFAPACWPAPSTAAAPGIVLALQMPAWIERDGARAPVKPGMTLRSGDQLSTGSQARVLLRLAEGSLIRLGENAQLNLDRLAADPVSDASAPTYHAVINVLKGAFRLTTSVLDAPAHTPWHGRDIRLRVSALTVQTGDADIWGMAAADQDVVCLLRGRAQLSGASGVTVMDRAMTFAAKPKQAAMQAVTTVPIEKLKHWLAKTELSPGQGITGIDGKWQVVLMSFEQRAYTTPVLKQLHDAGFAADTERYYLTGRDWIRLRIGGFPDRADARVIARKLNGRFGIKSPWVTTMQN